MNFQSIFAGILLALFLAGMPHAAFASDPPNAHETNSVVTQPALQLNPRSACPTACAKNAPPPNAAKMLPFQEMWALILKYQQKRASHFSPELIACLFWEESGFRLVEHPESHAVGYGQVLPQNLPGINKRFRTNFTKADLLTSPDASAEASILMLELMWQWKRDKVEALYAYAGGAPNRYVVHKWLTAESRMRQANMPFALALGMGNLIREQQIDAMRLCSQPGFDPRAIFYLGLTQATS